MEDEASYFNTLSCRCSLWCLGINKSGVGCQGSYSRFAPWLSFAHRVEALDEHDFIRGHVLDVVEPMAVVVKNAIRLSYESLSASGLVSRAFIVPKNTDLLPRSLQLSLPWRGLVALPSRGHRRLGLCL